MIILEAVLTLNLLLSGTAMGTNEEVSDRAAIVDEQASVATTSVDSQHMDGIPVYGWRYNHYGIRYWTVIGHRVPVYDRYGCLVCYRFIPC